MRQDENLIVTQAKPDSTSEIIKQINVNINDGIINKKTINVYKARTSDEENINVNKIDEISTNFNEFISVWSDYSFKRL